MSPVFEIQKSALVCIYARATFRYHVLQLSIFSTLQSDYTPVREGTNWGKTVSDKSNTMSQMLGLIT